jgi:RpiR family carbohydrate utilization transcriptional regulator
MNFSAPDVTSPILPSTQDQPGIYRRLTADLAGWPPVQRRLATYLLEHFATASDLGITDLASEARVSIGTVSSLCRRLGLRGYQDLRLGLAREAASFGSPGRSYFPSTEEAADTTDPVELAVARVFGANTETLIETARTLDRDALERSIAWLRSARRVEWFGVATAGLVAQEGALKLRKLGIASSAQPDSHAQAMSASVLTHDDVAVAVSHSGRTLDVLHSTRLARDAGARIIAITASGSSPLVDLADAVLAAVSYDTAFQIEPMASTIGQLSIVQCMFLALLGRNDSASHEWLSRTQAAVEPKYVRGRHG